MQSFFTWLIKNKYLENEPFEGIKYLKEEYYNKVAFTPEEFDRIFLSVVRDHQWPNKLIKTRNSAIIMLLVLTGVRRNELCEMKIDDLDFKKLIFNLRGETSKVRRGRQLKINKGLLPYLDDYLKERLEYKTPYLWVSNNRDDKLTLHGLKHLVNTFNKISGINCHLHRFRHTFAVNLYQNNDTRDPLTVSTALGHLGFRQTKLYLRSLPDSNVLRQMEDLRVAKFR